MQRSTVSRGLELITETFGLGRSTIFSGVFLTGVTAVVVAFFFLRSAPPTSITISAGPEGSVFQANAEKYRALLARNGITLTILTSKGSLENLQRLGDPATKVDVGFVQGGITNGLTVDGLVSLGSVAYQPLLVFHRSPPTAGLLSDFAGKRVSVGPAGSGTRSLALALLATNGIVPGGSTALLDQKPEEASSALVEGSIDALFLMGDSASPAVMRKLLRADAVSLFDFRQADGYTRRFGYLNKLELPAGSVDFGKGIPSNTVHLIGPTVELVARKALHPALSDLLLEAAREVHGGATLLQRRGEFPAPLEHDFPLSDDAVRFYKTGKTFLYRHLPFWLATLANRILVVLLPVVVVLIPALRLLPSIYRWRIRSRIYPWYRALLQIERELFHDPATPEERAAILERLNEIEKGVSRMKLPASFADNFYELRGHIQFVRSQLLRPPEQR
ncbi:MAG TPA: C4-dicarboxylate ABC transporter substrate-binding protein [Verrucomicrobiales bacterium]|nr:C4-dicarboxylate ABC transporter substrate-binding protein [Verrucomicrobiales bacterium]